MAKRTKKNNIAKTLHNDLVPSLVVVYAQYNTILPKTLLEQIGSYCQAWGPVIPRSTLLLPSATFVRSWQRCTSPRLYVLPPKP